MKGEIPEAIDQGLSLGYVLHKQVVAASGAPVNVARDQQSAQHAPACFDSSADFILDALSRERALHVRLYGRHIVGVEHFMREASEDRLGIQPEPVAVGGVRKPEAPLAIDVATST